MMHLKKEKTTPEKPCVGVYGLTGCAGCQLSIIFNENELLRLAELISIPSFPFIKEKKKESRGFDLVFMEGSVTHKDDLEVLKRIREKTKVLVALGACACTGGIQAEKPSLNEKNFERLYYDKIQKLQHVEKNKTSKPIDEYVKVDYYIPGCPPDKDQIKFFIKKVLLGKSPKPYDDPVCYECRLNQNHCLLEDNRICLGPITKGGCNAICINAGSECLGCRGPTTDANFKELKQLLLEKSVNEELIERRINMFMYTKLPEEYEHHQINDKKTKEPEKISANKALNKRDKKTRTKKAVKKK